MAYASCSSYEDDLFCEIWADHEWGGPVLVASGRHPIRGPFQTFSRQCRKCPRTTRQTRWMDPGVALRLAAFDAAKEE